jgi:chaperone modulatory protein CbpM
MGRKRETVSGCVLDEMVSLSLDELCRAGRVRREWILELVDEGILEPAGRDLGSWSFSGTSLRRVQKVWRLQHDLGVNLAGAALVLDLMEEISFLRARLDRFE